MKNMLKELLIPTPKSLLRELRTIRINPINDKKRNDLVKTFLDANSKFIMKKIASNKSLISALQELLKVYKQDDILVNYTLDITTDFMKNIVELFLDSEINYLILVRDKYVPFQDAKDKGIGRRYIQGNLLSYDLISKEFFINEGELVHLLNNIGVIVRSFSILLRIKNSEWLDEYFNLHQRYSIDKIYMESENLGSKRRSTQPKKQNSRGAKPKFPNEKGLHEAVKKIEGWKNLSTTKLSLKLGLSKNRLAQILKEKDWNLPE